MATGLSVFEYDSDGKILTQDLRLDESGDLVLVTGLDELRERVICRLQMFRGENVYNRSEGLPLTGQVLERPYSEALAASAISAEILNIPEVTSVEDVEVVVEDRHLSYTSARLTSIFGDLTIEIG